MANTPKPALRLSTVLHSPIIRCYQEAYMAACARRFEAAREWGRCGGSLVDELELLDQRQARDEAELAPPASCDPDWCSACQHPAQDCDPQPEETDAGTTRRP